MQTLREVEDEGLELATHHFLRRSGGDALTRLGSKGIRSYERRHSLLPKAHRPSSLSEASSLNYAGAATFGMKRMSPVGPEIVSAKPST